MFGLCETFLMQDVKKMIEKKKLKNILFFFVLNTQVRPSPIGAQTSPHSDLDEFDVITNRSKASPYNNGSNNNNCM